MSHPALSALVARAARVVAPVSVATDGDLLRRFARTRDGDAFAELVRRLGPMALGVCRRVARDTHLADDAFQAAFLVLARRAADVRPPEAVRGWLYGVAFRTAQEARTVNARRRSRETPVAEIPDRAAERADAPDADTLRALDGEIAGLPDHLRSAVVLCELDGLSRKDAAERLGVPAGTLSSRLAKARKLLAHRLRGRGIATAAGLAGLVHATVQSRLVAQTVALATAGAPIPTAVAVLTKGVFRTTLLTKLRAVPLAALAVGVLAWAALAALPAPPPSAAPATPLPTQPAPTVAPMPRLKGPNRILFWRDGKLATTDPDGKNVKEFALPKDEFHPMGGVRLSPDGERVAVCVPDAAEPDGPPLTLLVRGLGAKGAGTKLSERVHTFAWSPDGGRLAYTEYDPAARRSKDAHFIVDVATGATKPLKLPKWHRIIDWAWDGEHLLAAGSTADSKSRPDRLYLVSVASGESSELTDGKPSLHDGRISPDCRRVLTRGLVVFDLATKKATPVEGLDRNAIISGQCWSPDGKRIAYLWVRNPNRNLTPQEFKTIETERVLTVSDPDGKNAKTISTEKGPLLPLLQAYDIDWR